MPKYPTNTDDRLPAKHDGHISSIATLLYTENPEIQEFTVVEYTDPPLIQDRIPHIETMEVFKEAIKLREKTSLPFWDSALAQTLRGSSDVEPILSEALFHNPHPDVEHRVRSEGAASKLKELVSREWTNTTLAISSRVTLAGGSERHIPMLDFHIPSERRNYDIVSACLNSLAIGKFIIVDSGKSFHAYGLNVVNSEDLRSFLSSALLLSPIVDSRYIAHQLRDSTCKLRIAPTPRKPTQPRILGTT